MATPVVLVTGASRGIGQVLANLLADRGYTVFGASTNPSTVAGGRFEMLKLDLKSDESVQSCVTGLISRTGRIDVLVNNAGVAFFGGIEETSIDEAKALFEVNFFGMARMINAVLLGMRQRKSGLIINVGSLAAMMPVPFHAYLSASKAAVIEYSDTLRLEVKPFNIGVSVILPGMVKTHQGEAFEQLKIKRAISDYAGSKRPVLARLEEGQNSGFDPKVVAQTVLRIMRSKKPAPHYLIGPQQLYVWLSRFMSPSTVESMSARYFGLPR